MAAVDDVELQLRHAVVHVDRLEDGLTPLDCDAVREVDDLLELAHHTADGGVQLVVQDEVRRQQQDALVHYAVEVLQ
eukprot:12556043-Heterocapsa_arctica.AAC.1